MPIESVKGRETARRATALQREFNESFENERARLAKREDKAAALLANREKSSTISGTRFYRDLNAEGIILFRIHINSMIISVQAQNAKNLADLEAQKQKQQDIFLKKFAGQYAYLNL